MKEHSPNPFKELGQAKKPPDQIKVKVMTSAKFSHLVIQVADLFINKPIAIIGALINPKIGNTTSKKSPNKQREYSL